MRVNIVIKTLNDKKKSSIIDIINLLRMLDDGKDIVRPRQLLVFSPLSNHFHRTANTTQLPVSTFPCFFSPYLIDSSHLTFCVLYEEEDDL